MATFEPPYGLGNNITSFSASNCSRNVLQFADYRRNQYHDVSSSPSVPAGRFNLELFPLYVDMDTTGRRLEGRAHWKAEPGTHLYTVTWMRTQCKVSELLPDCPLRPITMMTVVKRQACEVGDFMSLHKHDDINFFLAAIAWAIDRRAWFNIQLKVRAGGNFREWNGIRLYFLHSLVRLAR